MWAIWTSRNKALHGSSIQDGKNTATFAKDYVDKVRVHSAKPHQHATKSPAPFSAAVHSSNVPDLPAATYCRIVQDPTAATSSSFAPNDHVSWHPPPHSGVKINVDAAVNSVSKQLEIGAIVRNHHGQVLAALSMPAQGDFRSDEMEAKALFHSLNWALQHQIRITHIETDALRVFQALTSSSRDLSCFSDLISDVRCLLSFFPKAFISHVKKKR
uniref:RNase H type-1 domain-containing protein n=1 Tax=Cannabis sativa TaxID=3483 RepID=A0A803Q017_CANSA